MHFAARRRYLKKKQVRCLQNYQPDEDYMQIFMVENRKNYQDKLAN